MNTLLSGQYYRTSNNDSLEIHHDGDLPSRIRIGIVFIVHCSLINAVFVFKECTYPKEIGKGGYRIERHVIGDEVGYQDQIWAAHGGMNMISLDTNGDYDVAPLILTKPKFESLLEHMLLFYTEILRFSTDISKMKIANISKKRKILTGFCNADEALTALTSENLNLEDIGLLLDETWKNKREMSTSVSNSQIDEIYEVAKSEGALGGKILGAGGGGFILLFSKPEFHQRIRERLSGLVEVSFGVSKTGSKIVVYEPSGF